MTISQNYRSLRKNYIYSTHPKLEKIWITVFKYSDKSDADKITKLLTLNDINSEHKRMGARSILKSNVPTNIRILSFETT